MNKKQLFNIPIDRCTYEIAGLTEDEFKASGYTEEEL